MIKSIRNIIGLICIFLFSCIGRTEQDYERNIDKIDKIDSISSDSGLIDDIFSTTNEPVRKTQDRRIPENIWINEYIRFGYDGADSSYLIIEKVQFGKPHASIFKFKNIKTIDFASRNVDSINFNIGDFLQLEEIIGYNNNITTLPQSLCGLKNLKEINLDANSILAIPDCITSLVNLELLFMGENKIKSIPNDIGKLKNLKRIQLQRNNISELPESFYDLVNLTYCYLAENQIRTIDKRIFELTKLESLYLCNNRLTEESKRILLELKNMRPQMEIVYDE